MLSLFLVHFLPTWIVGGALTYLLVRRLPRAWSPALRALLPSVVAAIAFAPTTAGIAWLRIPVPIPSLLVVELTDGDGGFADALRGAAASFAVGFVLFWSMFTLLDWRRVRRQTA
jgi:hypothetical protein